MNGRNRQNLAIIILAAGKGTRMKSDLAKVLHSLNGRAMIHTVLQTALKLQAQRMIAIVGHQRERVIEEIRSYPLEVAVQEPQLGTAHAVMCALPYLASFTGCVLILSGDVPLIRAEVLERFIERHQQTGIAATVMTAQTESPRGYGRILRLPDGNLKAIVEERDATEEIKKINEINSGIYLFEDTVLKQVLPQIKTDNDQKEYYLTEAVRLLVTSGHHVAAFAGDFAEVMGVNTVQELEEAARQLRQRELHV